MQDKRCNDLRKNIRPESVICPEGMWTPCAMLLLSEKRYGEQGHEHKMTNISQEFLHFLLVTPEIETFTINSLTGRKDPIDRDYLRSSRAIEHFIHGVIPFPNRRIGDDSGEYIFVNEEQFENYLADKPIHAVISNETDLSSRNSYVPAYLEFMLLAAKALHLSPDSRTNKKAISDWLTKNWPSDLEGKSDRLIEYMATLLRRPEDKKGGNTSWKNANEN